MFWCIEFSIQHSAYEQMYVQQLANAWKCILFHSFKRYLNILPADDWQNGSINHRERERKKIWQRTDSWDSVIHECKSIISSLDSRFKFWLILIRWLHKNVTRSGSIFSLLLCRSIRTYSPAIVLIRAVFNEQKWNYVISTIRDANAECAFADGNFFLPLSLCSHSE